MADETELPPPEAPQPPLVNPLAEEESIVVTPPEVTPPNPWQERVKTWGAAWVEWSKKIGPRWRAYREQWPRTFLVWFLGLLSLSILVWRFAPGDASLSTYTPAQGLLIPISVFGGPAIIAFFIASHGGLAWYSHTVAAKGLGLGLIDSFLKLRASLLRTLGFKRSPTQVSIDGVVDLPFPGLGHEGFQERYLAKSSSVQSEQVVEAIARYQLDNMGSIALNFITVYLLIKLPTIILWEVLSLTLEWEVYQAGFWLARTPFPDLTIYHWELFIVENLAVALVIFFQEVKLDTNRITLESLPSD